MNISEFRQNNESADIENKSILNGKLHDDLWQVISAFSNADGGTVNLGIAPNGDVIGVDPRYHDSLQADLSSYCKSVFNYKIYPDIIVRENGVMSVYIPPIPAPMRPLYSVKRGIKSARVRVGSANIQIDDEWMRRFGVAARGGAELMAFNGDYRQYFDLASVHDYLEIIRSKRGEIYKGLSIEEVLIKLRALEVGGKVTLFGLLAFGNDFALQELAAPTLGIAVTQYAGALKVNPEDIAEVSLDDKEFHGNAVSQFNNALLFIKSKLPVKGRVEANGKRVEYLAIPEVAIREALANTIVHRDYTTFSSKIQINIYSDRIEFINPGRSLIPLPQLASAHSQTRNPLLMNYLRDLNITEHRARGIITIKNSLKSAGLTEPAFEHRHDWFVATIYSSAFIQDEDQVWLQQFRRFKLKERQLNALVYCKYNKDGINNSEYRQLNNMERVGDDLKAKRDLNKLVKLGIFKRKGEKRYTRYLLIKM